MISRVNGLESQLDASDPSAYDGAVNEEGADASVSEPYGCNEAGKSVCRLELRSPGVYAGGGGNMVSGSYAFTSPLESLVYGGGHVFHGADSLDSNILTTLEVVRGEVDVMTIVELPVNWPAMIAV